MEPHFKNLHSTLRNSRFNKNSFGPIERKTYPRFTNYPLPSIEELPTSLSHTALQRRSARAFAPDAIPLATFSTILGTALAETSGGHVPYPSGGARYPIETYLVCERVHDVPSGFYHYRPDTHALEQLPTLSPPVSLSTYVHHDWAGKGAVLILFTATWYRSAEKYKDFAFELALLEAGHMGQNIVLASTAAGIESLPLGSFKEEILETEMDLDSIREQIVYSIVLGMPQKSESRG